MPTGQGDTFQESVPGQPHQDQKESVPCIEQNLQGLYVTAFMSGQGERETFQRHLLQGGIERNIARVESPQGRYIKGKRQSTVEPVFGTLTQFMGLRKINTIGLAQANKVMHPLAIAYNLKKYLKFDQKLVKSGAGVLVLATLVKRTFQLLFGAYIKHPKLAYNF